MLVLDLWHKDLLIGMRLCYHKKGLLVMPNIDPLNVSQTARATTKASQEI